MSGGARGSLTTFDETIKLQQPDAQVLIAAYNCGCFPMADPTTGLIDWYSPDPRGVLPLDRFHVPRSLARVVRQERFEIHVDRSFHEVLTQCSRLGQAPEQNWLDPRIMEAVMQLHRMGMAHSVEAWSDGRLVGGLYGISLGGAFFGESMFCRPGDGGRDASKVCLVHLVRRLRDRGYRLLDVQFVNDHLRQFGVVEIPVHEYDQALEEALRTECRFVEPAQTIAGSM